MPNEQETVMLPLTKPAEELLAEAFDLQELIKITTQNLNDMSNRRDSIIEELNAKGIVEAGNYELFTKVSVKNKINVERLLTKFPEDYARIVDLAKVRYERKLASDIALVDAERIIPKKELESVCDPITTTKQIVLKRKIE